MALQLFLIQVNQTSVKNKTKQKPTTFFLNYRLLFIISFKLKFIKAKSSIKIPWNSFPNIFKYKIPIIIRYQNAATEQNAKSYANSLLYQQYCKGYGQENTKAKFFKEIQSKISRVFCLRKSDITQKSYQHFCV